MLSELQVWGGFLLAFGLPGALWPYRVAKLGEVFDAIGRKGSPIEAEPADWNVGLTRILGVLGAFFGAVFLLGG